MACTGVVSWTRGPLLHKEEMIFPPQPLHRTTANFLGASLVGHFERLFSMPIADFIKLTQSSYKILQWHVVCDAASANMRLVKKLFAFLRGTSLESGQVVLCTIMPCFLHQMSRIVSMTLERHNLSNHLFCLTRLAQQAPTRRGMWEGVSKHLNENFQYHRAFPPPQTATSSSLFRASLFGLLVGEWGGLENELGPATEKHKQVVQALDFFNGDLTSNTFEHWCKGPHCCENREASLAKDGFAKGC